MKEQKNTETLKKWVLKKRTLTGIANELKSIRKELEKEIKELQEDLSYQNDPVILVKFWEIYNKLGELI